MPICAGNFFQSMLMAHKVNANEKYKVLLIFIHI